MGDFFRSTRFKVLFSILILLLFFMLRAAWMGGLSPMVSQITGIVVTPLQKVSSSISDAVSGYFARYTQADRIAAENEALREEVSGLRSDLVELEKFRQENSMLKKFLDIKEKNPDFVLEPAAVVARDPSDRFYSFTIDKGSLHGVKLRDTVITPEGLVGRIKEVGFSYAKVLTILDPQVNAGAYDIRTRDVVVVNGAIDLAGAGQCQMTYLPRESGVAIGDIIATTGGNIYPKDLIIGTISEVKTEPGGISLLAVITPAADIRGLTDVMVIKSYQGQEVAP